MTGLLLWRALYLTTWDPYALRKKQAALIHKTVTIKAPKGEFFDRNYYPLAMNVPQYRLFIDFHRLALSPEKSTLLLSYMAPNSQAYQTLQKKLQTSKYLYGGIVDYDAKLRLMDAKITGVHFEELIARYYTLGPALAQVLGRVDGDGVGLEGLEKLYNDHLAGTDSTVRIKQDRLGHTLNIDPSTKLMQAGQSMVLTIDHRIQQFAYKELLAQLKTSQAKAGAVVVLNASGDIVALVSAPSYDPNKPVHGIDDRMKNRAVVDIFEPGSIIKPIAFVGLLDHLSLNTLVDTEGGVYRLGRYSIKDVRHYGVLTLPEVMAKSSNVAMIKLTQKVGGDVLLKTYKDFKLFEPTYAGVLGEHVTLKGLRIKENTIPYYVLSYGYGMEVSMLQMAHAYVILSNRGLDPGLHIVDSKQLLRPPAVRVAKEKTVERVVQMMVKVVDEGTGHDAKVDNVSVAGKTGTTHIITSGKYDSDKHIASFVGFAPANQTSESEVYTIAVVIFQPKVGGHFGGQAAAPLFAKILKYALSLEQHIDVHPY